MSVYTYANSPFIDEVTFKTTAEGAVRAYLHARSETTPEQFQSVLNEFKSNGWQALAFNLDGKPTLEVRGLKSEAKFAALLQERGWASGPVEKTGIDKDRMPFMEKLHKRSLQASGVAMTVADVGFTVYGLKESKLHKTIDPTHHRDLREALAGLSYLSGSTVLGVYGRNDQSDLQVRDIAASILHHAKEKGLDVSDDSAANTIGSPRKENVLTKVHNFFRTHPSEIGNMSYFTAGLLISWSALQNRALAKPRPGMSPQQIKEMRKGGWGDTALGASTMASGLIATFGKEKAADPNAPEKHGVAGWFDKLQRSPLAIAGIGYLGSTLCHAYTTYTERKEALRAIGDLSLPLKERQLAKMKMEAIPWRVLFIGATIVGEILLTISSKGHGEGIQIDDTVDQSIYAVTADLIARQPANLQAGLIDYMAGYLADPKVLGGDRHKITTELRMDVEALQRNPWMLNKIELHQKEKAAAQGNVPAAGKPPVAGWQAKVGMSQQQDASPQLPA